MANKKLQEFVSVVCEQLGLEKKVLLVQNIRDVPEEYLELHMLTNALKTVKREYERKNSGYLKAFSFYSEKQRKGEISTDQFNSMFSKPSSGNKKREVAIA